MKDENVLEGNCLSPLGFLELVYGVLFDPVATFKRVVQNPPLGQTFLVFTLVNVIIFLMSGLVTPRLDDFKITSLAPFLAVIGFVFQYAKWFFYSSFLNLLAEFLGGQGKAMGVFITAGLAVLPSIFLVPVELLLMFAGVSGFTLTVITSLASFGVMVWGSVLLILGIREVHGFSTRRALVVVLIPGAVALIIGMILVAVFAAGVASLTPIFPFLSFNI